MDKIKVLCAKIPQYIVCALSIIHNMLCLYEHNNANLLVVCSGNANCIKF